MKKSLLLFFGLIVAISVMATEKPTQSIRKIENFSAIMVQNAIEVILQKGSVQKVVVETAADNQDNVVVISNGEKLSIKLNDEKLFKANQPKVKVYVTYSTLTDIFVSGASSVSASTTINQDKLLIILSGASVANLTTTTNWVSINCSGSSTCTIGGTTQKLNIKCSGASTIEARNLLAKQATAEVTGASSTYVNAVELIDMNISGASKLAYKSTENTKLIKNISGASSISKL